MENQLAILLAMSFSKKFLQLRKKNKLTQQQMADTVGMHITQVKRYEAGQAQPSIEVLKRIATAFNITTDWLIFEEGERELPDELKLKFEAVSKMSEANRNTIQSVIDGMILKQTSDQLGANR